MRVITRAFWMAVQIGAVAWFTYSSPPHPDSASAVFVGSIALLCIVPAQVLFYLLAEFARRAPVWVSMSMCTWRGIPSSTPGWCCCSSWQEG